MTMDERLSGKVAIVTGASRGIGRAIAVMLGSQRANVVLAARAEADLEATEQLVEDAGGRALVVVTDVCSEADVKRLVRTTVDAFSRLDIVINNAGVGFFAPLEQIPTEQWDRLMAVNARGPFLLCREAIPHLRAAGDGTIINISSVVGVKGYVNQGAYTASKHALMGMTKALAQELQADGIRVHTICPGGVATELISRARPDIDAADLMQPEDIADIVLFLLTRRGNAVIDDVHVRRAASSPWF